MAQNGTLIDGAEVRRRREALLLTQKQLADKAGIHQNTLIAIESDEPYRASFRTIRSLAKRLACPTSALLLNKEEVA